jgi:hypothetical protein
MSEEISSGRFYLSLSAYRIPSGASFQWSKTKDATGFGLKSSAAITTGTSSYIATLTSVVALRLMPGFSRSWLEKKMVWYCEEHWSQIPPSDRQAIGTIIIAGLSFDRIGLAKSGELADLVRRLLFSGVNPNKRYTWIKHGFSDDSARQVKLSLWEAYIEDFSNVWISRSETDIWWALEVMQLLLNDGHADTRCCLPAGKTSFLSALTFELDPKTIWLNAQNRNWSMFSGRLHVLLDAHGLLTPKERYVAREQGWIL